MVNIVVSHMNTHARRPCSLCTLHRFYVFSHAQLDNKNMFLLIWKHKNQILFNTNLSNELNLCHKDLGEHFLFKLMP